MTTKQFNKLSKKKQRILVAEDVIKQVKAEKYESSPGTYVSIDNESLYKAIDDGDDKDLCKVIDEIALCEVCARGALFLSGVRLGNKFQIAQLELGSHGESEYQVGVSYDKMTDHTSNIFDAAEQYLMEAAFEGYDVNGEVAANNDIDFDEFFSEVEALHHKYPDDNKRLIAIMKNVISNEGKFKL